MGRLTVRLPEALHRQLEITARKEGVSLNQYLVYALTRQATLDTMDPAPGTETRRTPSLRARNQEAVKEPHRPGDQMDTPKADSPGSGNEKG